MEVDPYVEDRSRFLDARAALQQGERTRFRLLTGQLEDYPLQLYLRYWELRRYIGTRSEQEIQAFLDRYADTPLATRLRHAWLRHLAKRKRWRTFLKFYVEPQTTELQCEYLNAKLALGQQDGVLERAEDLWLVGQSQPAACDPAFDLLYASPRMTSELIWERIRLAMARGKTSLAGFLAKKLSAEDRRWVERWQEAHRRPAKLLQANAITEDTPLAREILAHALKRLARHHPEEAWTQWDRLRQQFRFDAEQSRALERAMALSGALERHPRALEWLTRVASQDQDAKIHEWRARTALAEEDWAALEQAVDQMPAQLGDENRWRFWRAHAREARGHPEEARAVYTQLATERDYYGFLAADRLGQGYAMGHSPLKVEPARRAEIAKQPAIQRAGELHRAELNTDARREWFYATRDMDRPALEAAAALAHDWGWHDRAILTAAQAREYSDLELRFPLAHQNEVTAVAREYRMDPALIYGIIRQESAFMADARSSAGALGLMQLMPTTGRQTARELKIRLPSTHSLLQTDTNIRIGSAYLRRMLDRFQDNPTLAVAAYNAGPHRVDRWLPDEPQAATIWSETIPFTETRKYVNRVLAYAAVFEWRMQQPVTPLSQRLAEIFPKVAP